MLNLILLTMAGELEKEEWELYLLMENKLVRAALNARNQVFSLLMKRLMLALTWQRRWLKELALSTNRNLMGAYQSWWLK